MNIQQASQNITNSTAGNQNVSQVIKPMVDKK